MKRDQKLAIGIFGTALALFVWAWTRKPADSTTTPTATVGIRG